MYIARDRDRESMRTLCLLYWAHQSLPFWLKPGVGYLLDGWGSLPRPHNETRVVMAVAVRADLVREFFMVAEHFLIVATSRECLE